MRLEVPDQLHSRLRGKQVGRRLHRTATIAAGDDEIAGHGQATGKPRPSYCAASPMDRQCCESKSLACL